MKTDQASNTALIVAAGVQMLARDPAYAGLVPAAIATHGQRLLRASHPRLSSLTARHWFRSLAYTAAKFTLPGILPHYVLRKIFIRKYVARSITAGSRQIVLLGAGYDTLCMELATQYPDLKLIEIDHPATQAVKRAAAGASGAAVAAGAHRIHYIAAELGKQKLNEVLSNCKAFNPDIKTLFIAEGLLMYLTSDDIASLLKQMQMAATKTALVFTWMEIQANGQPNFRPASKIIDFLLKKKAEPFLSGMPQDQVPAFLKQLGYAMQDLKESASICPQDCRIKPIAGEYICMAQST
ncbi:class I SAM-dependent methyltransferase [Undibacterium sp. Tian12W]|uniref:class I SAM-dependent methyltransferase n=1 Tax=Undibacterium sp. Tian12W TaxID=3413054 RepID=UPI003BF355DE